MCAQILSPGPQILSCSSWTDCPLSDSCSRYSLVDTLASAHLEREIRKGRKKKYLISFVFLVCFWLKVKKNLTVSGLNPNESVKKYLMRIASASWVFSGFYSHLCLLCAFVCALVLSLLVTGILVSWLCSPVLCYFHMTSLNVYNML